MCVALLPLITISLINLALLTVLLNQVYVNCHCIPDGMKLPDSPSQAQDGKCPQTCSLLYVYLPMMFATIFLTFMAGVPTTSVTLR